MGKRAATGAAVATAPAATAAPAATRLANPVAPVLTRCVSGRTLSTASPVDTRCDPGPATATGAQRAALTVQRRMPDRAPDLVAPAPTRDDTAPVIVAC